MKKVLPLIAIMAGIALIFASVGFANVPAPPVNQTLGLDDHTFNNLVEAECRGCHGSSLADTHHMLYGSTMPVGQCSTSDVTECELSGDPCANDAECAGGLCTTAGTSCYVDTDCLVAGDTCDDIEGCEIVVGPCFSDAECAVAGNICNIRGQDCPVGLCEDGTTSCEVDADCAGILGETCDAASCPQSYTGQVCGQPFCMGATAAPNNPNNGVYGCLACHDEDTTGGVINFIRYTDCLFCHQQGPNQPSVHHLDEAVTGAKAGECVACHGDIVDNKDDGHYIPTYNPSLVTPEPSNHAGDPHAGTCDFCHNEGTDTDSLVEVVDNHDTHHGAGVYKNRYGGTFDSAICGWCHLNGNPHAQGEEDYPYAIRTCENCHGPESLHNIQADSDASGTIVVGGELAGYGHIGKDDPGSDSDCWGCHGFSVAADGAAIGSGVPSIDTVAPLSITAGTPTAVTVTGAALTTAVPEAASDVRLTAADGSTVTIVAPDSISEGSLTVTINAAAWLYNLQAVKDGEASNAVGIAVLPAVAITEIDCSKCLGVMTITGANFAEMPAGADEINVTEDGRVLDVIEWTDGMIKAAGARCRGDVTVNSVYGASQ